MAKRHIDYGRLVEQALRTVVRDVLQRVATEGLIGSHHFYITFRTHDPGVDISDYLRDRYPTEMTIVLQYQFWDLEVDEEGFAVTLSFNNAAERLVVPFSAVKVFADPGAEFGLQFTIEPEQRVVMLPTAPMAADPEPAEIAARLDEMTRANPEPGADDGDENVAPDGDRPGAEIVTLDRFRKK